MKILLLNYEFPPLGGGAGNITRHLINEFSARSGLDFCLITSSTAGFKQERAGQNGRIFYLDIGKTKNWQRQSPFDLMRYGRSALKFSRQLIAKEHFDLIHAFFTLPSGFVAMKLNQPFIVSLMGSDVPGHNPSFGLYYLLTNFLTKKIWCEAEAVVANSQDLKISAGRFYQPKNFWVVPTGVDLKRFQPAPRQDQVFRVVFAGRFSRVKGIDYLIRAFKKFAAGKNDVELVLAGDGPRFKKTLAANKNLRQMLFRGSIDQDELALIYRRADVFVLPSINEGMSCALLEAMASGLAVIATATGGAAELIGCRDLIVRKRNSHDIAAAIETLYQNPERLAEIKAQNVLTASKYCWSKIADGYLSIYNRCLAT